MKKYSANWMHTENFDRFLAPLAGKPGLRFLEIGCFEGMGTCYFLDHFLTHPSSFIDVIDPFDFYPIPGWNHLINPGTEQIFKENVREYGARVILHKGKSVDVLPRLPLDLYDFIYVDGDHRRETVYQDAIDSLPLLKAGGIMIFDDYTWGYDPRVKDNPLSPHDAVDQFLKEHPELVILATNLQKVVKK